MAAASLLSMEQARRGLASGLVGLRSWQLAHSLFPDDHAVEIEPSLDLGNGQEVRKRLEERRLLMQAPELLGAVERWWRCCERSRADTGYGAWDDHLRRDEYIRLNCRLLKALYPQ
eukprot:1699302-Prymnesium_polylepis.1